MVVHKYNSETKLVAYDISKTQKGKEDQIPVLDILKTEIKNDKKPLTPSGKDEKY